MNNVPDDILLSIFDSYVHDLKKSPVLLLAINRRWHTLAATTPSLWTRIVFNITNVTIPYLLYVRNRELKDGIAITDRDKQLDPSTILPYVARSIPHDSSEGLPLEIEINWATSWDFNAEYEFASNYLGIKPIQDGVGSCDVHEFRMKFLNQLFSSLVEMTSLYSSDKKGRWLSMTLDLSACECPCHGTYLLGNFLEHVELLSLRQLTLRGVLCFHPLFKTPALEQLTLENNYIGQYPHLKSVKHLIIKDHATSYSMWRFPPPWSDFLNLETITIGGRNMPSISFRHFFPQLRSVQMLGPADPPGMLESLFERSRPIRSLTMTQTLSTTVSLFQRHPEFHVDKLTLNIHSVSTTFQTNSIPPEDINDAVKLLDICRERNILLEEENGGLMESILEVIRSRDRQE